MTPWLERGGSGDAPTTAIVRASRRISTGSRASGSTRVSFARCRTSCASPASSSRAAPTRDANLAAAERLVERAAAAGARLVAAAGEVERDRRPRASCTALAEPLDGGATVAAMAELGAAARLWLVGGSITERREGRERLSNTCCVFDARRLARGRLPQDPPLRRRGRRPRLPRVGRRGAGRGGGRRRDVDGWRVGLSVCYDVRFPELYRVLRARGRRAPDRAGELHARRPARTTGTCCCAPGRSRASATSLAAAQVGEPAPGRPSYGHSRRSSTLGHRARRRAGRGDGDRRRPRPARGSSESAQTLPSLANRRPDAYRVRV